MTFVVCSLEMWLNMTNFSFFFLLKVNNCFLLSTMLSLLCSRQLRPKCVLYFYSCKQQIVFDQVCEIFGEMLEVVRENLEKCKKISIR